MGLGRLPVGDNDSDRLQVCATAAMMLVVRMILKNGDALGFRSCRGRYRGAERVVAAVRVSCAGEGRTASNIESEHAQWWQHGNNDVAVRMISKHGGARGIR